MTFHLDSHTTTDGTPDMLSGILTGNRIQHEEFNIGGIAHVHAQGKEDVFMQKLLVQSFTCIREWGYGTKLSEFF